MPYSTKLHILATAVVLTLLSGCSEPQSSEKEQPEIFAVPVMVSSLERGQISSNYHSTAVLESINDAEVVTRVTGIIDKFLVEEGDYVEQGQLIAEIDPRRYQLRLAQADAELASINQELTRAMSMYKRKLISTDRVDKLTYQQQSAKATRDLAQLELKDSRIIAPISGYIAEKLVKQGHFTQGFQKLVHIVDQQQLQAVLHLPEHQLANVALAQTANLTFSAYPNQQFVAKVRSISPIINTKSGTFKVIMSLPNKSSTLKPGMFAQVALVFSTHENVLRVTSDAIITRDGRQYVYVVDGDKAQEVEIVSGFVERQLTEISGAIEEGAHIIVSGQHNIKSDTVIKVLNDQDSQHDIAATTISAR